MKKPQALSLEQEFAVIGKIFNAPLVVVGKTWYPITEIVVLGIMTYEAGRRHPERGRLSRLGVAALNMPIILGSEWCHNLAHAAAAKFVGHPVDAIRVVWGMPMLVYHDIEDPDVTPRAHILRALGGPIINTIFFLILAFLRPLTKPKLITRDIVNAALGMNAFLVLGGMLPIPGIDGGAVLKWVLVEKGKTPTQADQVIRKVNAATTVGLGTGAVVAIKKRKRLLGGIFTMFAGISLLIATGLLREQE